MIRIFRLKNWETFLVLFLIPLMIHLNLPFLTGTIIPSAIFVLIWTWIISFWIFYLSDHFKTKFLEKFEFRLLAFNLLLINLIFIVIVPIGLLMFYKDIPAIENTLGILSKIDDYLRIYLFVATIVILVIASRILTAKRLQRNLSVKDYYKCTIAFVFLPIGIFWIQNDIIKVLKVEKTGNKKRSFVIIMTTILLLIMLVFNLIVNDFKVVNKSQKTNDFTIDSVLFKKAIQKNDSLIGEMNDSAKAEYIFNAALQLYQMGNYRSAIDNLNSSIKLNPKESEYYYNRGVIFCEQFNKLDSAIMDMTKTIELEPSDWRAYQNRGYYNFLLEKYDKVLPDVNKAINLKADFSNAYLLRGLLKERLKDKDGACMDLRKADSLGNADAMLKIMEICN
jgi:hypothetical protein